MMTARQLVRRLLGLDKALEHSVEEVPQVGRAGDTQPQPRIELNYGLIVGVHADASEPEADRFLEQSSLGAYVPADRLNVVGVREFEKSGAKWNGPLNGRAGVVAHVHPSLLNIQSVASLLRESRGDE